MASVFVDTNIFLSCFDTSNPAKREIAQNVIASVGPELVASTQVLQEFYWNATKKLRMTPEEAKSAVELISQRRLVQIDASIVIHSIETSDKYRLSFWDALIVEAAAMGRCSKLLTEDLNHGQVIRGVRVKNPFKGD